MSPIFGACPNADINLIKVSGPKSPLILHYASQGSGTTVTEKRIWPKGPKLVPPEVNTGVHYFIPDLYLAGFGSMLF